MKRTILLALFVVVAMVAAIAQTDNAKHHFVLGVGTSVTDNFHYSGGLSVTTGYGYDICLSERFSLMPSVGLRVASQSAVRPNDASPNLDDFVFADLAAMLRYRIPVGSRALTLGVGPYVSYTLVNDRYNTGDYPASEAYLVNGKAKIGPVDFGFVPMVSFSVSQHFDLGARASFGLKDVAIHYAEAPGFGSKNVETFEVFAAFKF